MSKREVAQRVFRGQHFAWFLEEVPLENGAVGTRQFAGPVVFDDKPAYVIDSTGRKWQAYAEQLVIYKNRGTMEVTLTLTGEEEKA